MRFFEISSGLRVPVSNEEQQLLDRILECGKVAGKSLDERQLEVARLMCTRGLLNRIVEGNRVLYEPNGLPDLWR